MDIWIKGSGLRVSHSKVLSSLKTLEWDILNLDRLINLDINIKRRTCIPLIHHSIVPSSTVKRLKILKIILVKLFLSWYHATYLISNFNNRTWNRREFVRTGFFFENHYLLTKTLFLYKVSAFHWFIMFQFLK